MADSLFLLACEFLCFDSFKFSSSLMIIRFQCIYRINANGKVLDPWVDILQKLKFKIFRKNSYWDSSLIMLSLNIQMCWNKINKPKNGLRIIEAKYLVRVMKCSMQYSVFVFRIYYYEWKKGGKCWNRV